MGAMVVLWSFLGVLKHLLAPPLRCPCLLPLKKIIILHLFLGVPAATVGGTGTPWHTRGYAPELRDAFLLSNCSFLFLTVYKCVNFCHDGYFP